MSSLLRQLKKLKNDPRVGSVTREEHAKAKDRLLAILEIDKELTFEVQPSYGTWFAGNFISKPVVLGAAVLTMAVGSFSTVNAATDALPGETLYSVKRITEQAQLKLATLDRRAVLHTEFAERRLNEASELQKSATENPEHVALAKTAMADYEAELTKASADLREMKGTSSAPATLAVVANVQDKIGAMETVIDANVAASQTVEDGEEALQAKHVAKEAQQAATTVAVELHEEQGSELTTQEMKDMFKKDLGNIEARQTFDEHRLAILTATIAAHAELFKGMEGVPNADDLKRMGYVITQTKLQIPEAMNGFAAGGYRSAFETLQGVDEELLSLEAQLADVEITVMNAIAIDEAAQIQAEAEAAASAEEGDSETPVTPAP